MNMDDLIQRHLDGVNSATEAAELSRRLETDAAARSRYLDLAQLHASLAADESLRSPRFEKAVLRPQSSWVAPVLKAAAALVLAALVFWSLKPASGPLLPFATLISTENARWSDEGMELSLNAGEPPNGMLRLIEGQAEFVTSKGASVRLTAPAAVRFDSPISLFVESGKVLCRCPTLDSRMSVQTPQTRVVDLGTEFAVEARADASTRVAVLSGEVRVDSTVLHQGQAAEVRHQGVTMLHSEVVQDMITVRESAAIPQGESVLLNGHFDTPSNWELQDRHSWIENGTLLVRSGGHRFWPNARQTLWKVPSECIVTASVRAMQREEDPLQPQQFAVLKIVFVGEGGKQIAYASRHFQFAGETPNVFQKATLTAITPPGTKGVTMELLLNARGELDGSMIFDDAVLTLGESETPNVTTLK
jgi:ferric-dicitrate binding protein FerR (iron transport regulator)